MISFELIIYCCEANEENKNIIIEYFYNTSSAAMVASTTLSNKLNEEKVSKKSLRILLRFSSLF